ncbi:MAG: pyrroline-5-carboxylate reductase [Clostridia bacterium]|nr:pyrroline-5-carboxylate reductase [Clostridia bacterium]
MKTIFGFIGCGNMGGTLAESVAKTVLGEQIMVCDAVFEKAERLAMSCGMQVTDLISLAKSSQYIFIGVKPQGAAKLFDTIRPILQKRKDPFVLISMLAGTSIATLTELAGCKCPIIRIMPNTPASVGEGMILYDYNSAVSEEQLSEFTNAFSEAGRLDHLPEASIDAASALSGCGPAFVFLFAEALADAGVECGLKREQANLYAAQTLLGSAKLLLESGKHPGVLKDAVCSPGGTTIAGIHALEEGGFRAAAINAVTAAYEKTLKLKG